MSGKIRKTYITDNSEGAPGGQRLVRALQDSLIADAIERILNTPFGLEEGFDGLI